MARFILPNKFIWGLLVSVPISRAPLLGAYTCAQGMLQVLEPVPEDLLELVFCAMYVKHLCDDASSTFR